MQQPAHGVMVSHAMADGTVTTRLWIVSSAVADRVAEQLGPPTMEQLQTREQALAGAAAGGGSVTYGRCVPDEPADGAW